MSGLFTLPYFTDVASIVSRQPSRPESPRSRGPLAGAALATVAAGYFPVIRDGSYTNSGTYSAHGEPDLTSIFPDLLSPIRFARSDLLGKIPNPSSPKAAAFKTGLRYCHECCSRILIALLN
jgi:hypothetical protein